MSGEDHGARGRAPSPFSRSPGGTAASPSASGGTAARPSAFPLRRHPTHLPNIERSNQPVILFVTVCAKDRRPILASDRLYQTLRSIWPQARQYLVGRFVVMPDHIHLFCAPAVHEPENVKRWVGYWKRLTSLALKDLGELWQRDCWDKQLRRGEKYSEKWEYVRQNPVRKGLVARAEDWPFQGCLNELRW